MLRVISSDSGRAAAGFGFEKNDCTVRAAVVRFTMPYQKAHDILAQFGRRNGRGLLLSKIKTFLEEMGLEVFTPYLNRAAMPTVARFIKDNPKGRFYVLIRGHAFGVNNGVIIDNAPARSRAKVLMYA